MSQPDPDAPAQVGPAGEAAAFEKELYRDPADGHEKWRIKEIDDGKVVHEGVESDRDAQWVLDTMNFGEDYADEQQATRER